MKHIRRIVIVLIWLLIWQFASMMTGLELLLASPVAVLKTIMNMLVSQQFYVTLMHSMINIGTGLMAGIVFGVILGICAAKYRNTTPAYESTSSSSIYHTFTYVVWF